MIQSIVKAYLFRRMSSSCSLRPFATSHFSFVAINMANLAHIYTLLYFYRAKMDNNGGGFHGYHTFPSTPGMLKWNSLLLLQITHYILHSHSASLLIWTSTMLSFIIFFANSGSFFLCFSLGVQGPFENHAFNKKNFILKAWTRNLWLKMKKTLSPTHHNSCLVNLKDKIK